MTRPRRNARRQARALARIRSGPRPIRAAEDDRKGPALCLHALKGRIMQHGGEQQVGAAVFGGLGEHLGCCKARSRCAPARFAGGVRAEDG